MKNRIRRKLASERGASITFALLLFLVCSVLCSVILAAATAASGRMSRIAETDQRYYSVTSAAELLKDLIDGETVSIVKVETWEKTTPYSASGVKESVVYNEVPDNAAVYLVGLPMGEIDGTKLIPANKIGDDTAFSIDTIQEDAAYRISQRAADASDPVLENRALNLTPSFTDSGTDGSLLAASISEDLYSDGKMVFTIYNAYKSNAGNRYQLVITFGADKNTVESEKEVDAAPVPVSGGGYTVKTTKTKTTTTTYTWRFLDIKTVD